MPGQPAPSFNTTTKTCSNVSCHATPTGTFADSFPGGDGEPVEVTVSTGGLGIVMPAWNSTVSDCGTCHGNPPQDGTVWHSGMHAAGGPTGAANQCQFCHRDAVSTAGVATGLSTPPNCGATGTTPCASLHRNGVLDVQATFRSSCFGCH